MKGEQIELQQTTGGHFPRRPSPEEFGTPGSGAAASRIDPIRQSIPRDPADCPDCFLPGSATVDDAGTVVDRGTVDDPGTVAST
jgi:hypothetical protein